MSNFAWLRPLGNGRARTAPAQPRCRPQLEALEDRTVPSAVGTPNENFVDQLYRDLLHRVADPVGLVGWSHQIDSGRLSRQEVALNIRGSDEGLGVQVNDLYVRFLRRSASPAEQNGWKPFLSDHSTEDLEERILASQEYFSVEGGGTVNGWLNSVYLDVLCRPIGAGEVGFWSSRAGTGSEGRLGVAEDIVESHEARTDEIKGFYTAYLRRPADPGGLDFWTRLLESGDADKGVNNDHVPRSVEDNDDAIIVADILSSPEYFQDSQVLATFATIPTCM